jgi:hypothetical protein
MQDGLVNGIQIIAIISIFNTLKLIFMKTIFTSLLLIAFTFGASAQMSLIDFESSKDAANWGVFANGATGQGGLSIVDNPDKTEINNSDSVLRFKVDAAADPWAGAANTKDISISITDKAHVLTMMVYKNVISRVDIQLMLDNGDKFEIFVPNTVVDKWELLSFDFSSVIGKSYNGIAIFPDYPLSRTAGSICYVDNIVGDSPTAVKQLPSASIKVFPNPADEVLFVQYPDMTGLTISNLLGKTIKTYKFQTASNKSIELSDLQEGMYFVSVESGSGSYSAKFIKK